MTPPFLEKFHATLFSLDSLALVATSVETILVLFLCFKILSLYRSSQKNWQDSQNHKIPMWLSSLSEFADFQLRELRDRSGKASFQKSIEKVNEVGLFFIGAVEYVVRKESLSTQQRHLLTVQLLQSSLNYSAKDISKVYSHALSTCSNSPARNSAKIGAQSFGEWMSPNKTKIIPSLASVLPA